MIKRVASFTLRGCLALLLLCSLFAHADEERDTLKKLKAVQKQISNVQNQLDSVEKERGKLNNALRKAEIAIGGLYQKIRNVSASIDDNERAIVQLEADRKKLQDSEVAQREIMREHIIAVYAMGRQSRLKLILNEENPDQIARTLVYYETLRDARHEDIAKYRATQQKLAEIAPKLATQRQELEDNRTKLIAQRNELGEEQKQRQSTVTQLNRDIANQQQKLNQLKKDQSQLEGVLKTLQEAIANMAIPSDFAPFSSRLGKLRWPVDGKRQNTFGSSRGAEINWQGISISGREGSAVKSIHSGRVVFADWLKGYGLLMIIDHGEDYLSLYAHNQSLLKGLGDWINPGEAIATVGKSGGKDDASVYFEIRHAGKAVDPARWCK